MRLYQVFYSVYKWSFTLLSFALLSFTHRGVALRLFLSLGVFYSVYKSLCFTLAMRSFALHIEVFYSVFYSCVSLVSVAEALLVYEALSY